MAQMEELRLIMESRLMASIGGVDWRMQDLDGKKSSPLTRLEKVEKALEKVNEYLKDNLARIDYNFSLNV